MRSYKLLNIFVMLFLLVSPLFAGGSQALASVPQSAGGKPALIGLAPNDEIGSTNSGTGQMRTTTQAMREAAAYQNKEAQRKMSQSIAGIDKTNGLISPLSADAIAPLAQMAPPLSKPDYFGVANWALSPLPTIGTGGAITGGIKKFIDTLPGLCGVPTANGSGSNSLGQCLPLAVPDTTTFPGSDYYEIGLIQYLHQFSPNLPPTLVRGYVQLETTKVTGAHVKLQNAAGPNGQGGTFALDRFGNQVYGVTAPSYLGPVIVASGCDPAAAVALPPPATCTPRPVRVKFTNFLPTGTGGDLFIPTDTTYMGAGMGPGGSVFSINVTAGGSGYITTPTVTISAPPTGFTQATAVAAINNGVVVSVLVTNGGTGYSALPAAPPTVTITGGGGTGATATAFVAGNTGDMYTQNRGTLHLHGGNTPWISDGTPHQWTVPVGQVTSYQKGDSVEYVPDMCFDNLTGVASAAPTPPAGQPPSCPTGTDNNPGQGSLDFYWTNEQSGRLMFYHDHSYGITRLNVYAGEAGGYLIVDQNQENALAALGVPGTLGTSPDFYHLVPLVVQDKTFVPDSGVTGGQLASEDPTWDATNFGGAGALWFPHVYTPNQNPADVTGANAFGRWDYGAWFWPPQNPATYVPTGQPYTCSSIFYNGTSGPAFPPLTCPGIPNPSGVPEGFMDTPMINGTVYPTLTVDPTAYRFQLLNAGNDRTLNLGLYMADPLSLLLTNGGSGYTTPPAVSFTGGGGLGAAAHAVVSTGSVNSILITGVGHGYTSVPNVTITGTGTGATAVAVVDPITTTLLAINVTSIGTGYTSATVAVDPPANCTAGCTTATAIANITPAGVLLDVVVDNPGSGWTSAPTVVFTGGGGSGATAVASVNSEVKMVPAVPPMAGSKLQPCVAANPTGGSNLVNGLVDATGPINGTGLPANCWPSAWPTDGRDGGVPDPTTAGPAIIQIATEGGLLPAPVVIPSTPVGYEYNRRSITVLNVFTHGLLVGPAERADFLIDFSKFAGQTLIFYNDAPAPVPAFDPRNDYYTGDPDQTSSGGAPTTLPGYGPNTRTLMQIKVNVTAGGVGAAVSGVTVTNGGSGYKAPSVSITGGGGSGAAGTASGTVSGLTLTSAGSGYTSPVVTFSGGGGTGATAQMNSGAISSLTLTASGAGYATMPVVGFTGGGGSLASATATGAVDGITVTGGGAGYASMPTISFTGGGGTGAAASATGAVDAITVSNGGAGYATLPTVSFTGGGGTGTTTTVTGSVDAIAVGTAGAGYHVPAVSFSGGGGTGTTATASGLVDSVTLGSGGTGYTAPVFTLSGGGGTGATASATVLGGVIQSPITFTGGSGYTSAPTVTIKDVGPGTGATASATLTGGVITGVTINTGGTGYLNPVVTISDATGTGAVITVTQTSGVVNPTATIVNGGTGYTAPVLTISDAGNGAGASATATISVTAILVTAGGTGYTAPPTVTVGDSGTPGTPAAATATLKVSAVAVTAGGAGYTAAPTVVFSSGAAAATATLKVSAVAVTAGGAGYTAAPTVVFSSGAAAATATLKVTALAVTSPGSGYTSAPVVGFTGGGGTGAAATAAIAPTGIMITSGGTGYTSAPTVTITDSGGTGSGAAAVATLSITAVTLTSPGSGYTSVPLVSFTDTGLGTGAAATANLVSGAVFNMAKLAAPTGLSAIFAYTQDQVMVPEPSYPANNGFAANTTYSRIQDTSLNIWLGTGNALQTITLTNGGAGYSAAPTVTISGGGGSGATATALLAGTSVASITLGSGGSGYTSAPTVVFAGGGGTGAAATATLAPRGVASATVTNQGNGYTARPTVVFSAPQTVGGTTAVGTAVMGGALNRRVVGITINNPGTGYTAAPTITISGGGGSGARAVAVLAPTSVAKVTLTNGGSGYTSAPTVTFVGGGGTGATASAVTLIPTSVASITLTNFGAGYTSAPTVSFSGGGGAGATAVVNPPTTQFQPKAIQELFTVDYGRMNATLGVELPFTNFLTQTTIPYGYVDPPTELFTDGEVQIWKITHNGVDTHFIHFHLFTVQVLNRVGWDGMIKPPDQNEMSFKDTVRMNPLEDIIVALHPMKQTLPWQLPLSQRPMDVTESIGSSLPNQFTGIDPANQPAAVNNDVINYGYEYVWHCHILGHEENDMMRAMMFAVPPVAPSTPTQIASPTGNRAVKLIWTDNSLNETGFTIQRSITNPTGASGPSWVTVGTAPASPGIGGRATFVDLTVAMRTPYWYQVIADNVVGYTQTYAAPTIGYPTVDAASAPSGYVAVTTTSGGNIAPFSADNSAYVFANSFLKGTLGWAGAVGDVQVSKAASMDLAGAKGMETAITSNAPQGSFVADNSPAGIGTYDAAFEFNPNGAVSGSDPVDIFVGLDQTGLPAFGIQYQKIMVEAEPVYQVRSWMQVSGDQLFSSWKDVVGNSANRLELAWTTGTNGALSLYVGNTLVQTLTGDTSGHQLFDAMLGPSGGLSGASGTMYFDEFTSTTLSGITYNFYLPQIHH